MRQLPPEKIPKLNTDGEKYRDLQLVYQLPKQDLSLKYCHHVDPVHHTSFQAGLLD
jgi:prickle